MNIREEYYRNFDPSSIMAFLNDPKMSKKIGQGRHFSCFLWENQGYKFTISLARPGFYEGLESAIDQWGKDIYRIQSLNHPLVPPMEVLKTSDKRISYVQPYCEGQVSSKDWAEPLAELERDLNRIGLQYDDYWQLRTINGQPFVIDWSDLKRCRSF